MEADTLASVAGRINARAAVRAAEFPKTLDNGRRTLDARTIATILSARFLAAQKNKKHCGPRLFRFKAFPVQGVCLSIQVAILKILASHGSGRAEISSINRDIAILTASGAEWSARIKRLAARAPGIDIFGDGYVRRGDEGWEITAEGRAFLAGLEAVTQDNLPSREDHDDVSPPADETGSGDLIVVGHRFRNRLHRPAAPRRVERGLAVGAVRHGENASS